MSKKTIKQKKVMNEDMTYIKNMFIILGIVVLVSVGLYFLTEKLNKNEDKPTDSKVSINYDLGTVGTMFNRIEDEYYVILYSKEENGNDLDSLLDTYRSSDEYIKTYFVNLDDKINSSAISDELVRKPKNASEVKVNGPTLYKIKDGIVTNCYSGVDDITKVLEGNN